MNLRYLLVPLFFLLSAQTPAVFAESIKQYLDAIRRYVSDRAIIVSDMSTDNLMQLRDHGQDVGYRDLATSEFQHELVLEPVVYGSLFLRHLAVYSLVDLVRQIQALVLGASIR